MSLYMTKQRNTDTVYWAKTRTIRTISYRSSTAYCLSPICACALASFIDRYDSWRRGRVG